MNLTMSTSSAFPTVKVAVTLLLGIIVIVPMLFIMYHWRFGSTNNNATKPTSQNGGGSGNIMTPKDPKGGIESSVTITTNKNEDSNTNKNGDKDINLQKNTLNMKSQTTQTKSTMIPLPNNTSETPKVNNIEILEEEDDNDDSFEVISFSSDKSKTQVKDKNMTDSTQTSSNSNTSTPELPGTSQNDTQEGPSIAGRARDLFGNMILFSGPQEDDDQVLGIMGEDNLSDNDAVLITIGQESPNRNSADNVGSIPTPVETSN